MKNQKKEIYVVVYGAALTETNKLMIPNMYNKKIPNPRRNVACRKILLSGPAASEQVTSAQSVKVQGLKPQGRFWDLVLLTLLYHVFADL